MKKLVVFPVLLALLLAPVFGQEDEREPGWTFSGDASVTADLIYFGKASGKTGSLNGATNEKTLENVKGVFNVMNSSFGGGSAIGVGSSFFIKGYDQGDNYGYDLLLQLKVGFYGSRATTIFSGDAAANFLQIFNAGFGDWYLTGNAGIFEGYIGNTGYGGYVNTFGNFNDWGKEKYSDFLLDGFYVKTPEGRQGSDNMNLWSGGSAFALALNFKDDTLRFALGTDFGYGADGVAFADYPAYRSPYASANSFNLAAMFSAKGLADLLSFDVFYGLLGDDLNTNTFGNQAAYTNVFGLYVGLDIGDSFGLSVGYTGSVDITEKQYSGTEAYSIKSPFYSAVSVHLNFTGLDKWDFTLNNNLSFASSKYKPKTGASDPVINGLYGFYNNPLDPIPNYVDGDKQGWFGWDLGLAVKFQATEALGIGLQLTNQLGIGSETTKASGDKKSSWNNNLLFVALNAEYTIKMVTFGAGLTFGMASDSSKFDGTKGPSSSQIGLGVPLFFKVVF